jgi:gas vesicle protein
MVDLYELESLSPGLTRQTTRLFGRFATWPFTAAATTFQHIRDLGLGPGLTQAALEAGEAFDGFTTNAFNSLYEGLDGLSTTANQAIEPINWWAGGTLGEEIAKRGGLSGIASDAWDSVKQTVHDSITQPNSRGFEIGTAATGLFGSGLSLGGYLTHALTGSQTAADVAGVGELIGGAADLVGMRGSIVNLANSIKNGASTSTASAASSSLGFLGKFAGGLAVVTGGFTMITEGSKAIQDFADDGKLTEAGAISTANAIAGALATAGGATMLIPGAQVAAPVLLGLSGIISAGTWVYENRDRLKDGLDALGGAIDNAGVIVNALPGYVASQVSSAAQQVGETVRDTVQSVVDTVSETAQTVMDTVSDTASVVADAVTNTIEDVKDTVSDTISNVADSVSGFVNNLFGGGD